MSNQGLDPTTLLVLSACLFGIIFITGIKIGPVRLSHGLLLDILREASSERRKQIVNGAIIIAVLIIAAVAVMAWVYG